MKKTAILISSIILLVASAKSGLAQENSASKSDSLKIKTQEDNLRRLQADILSGKPTLAFFYYSVACSCTAARCAIASAAIDSIPQLDAMNDSLNFGKVDAYLMPEAESLFNLMIMPAVVYFDKDGQEINRLEWGTSREAIEMLIEHPEEKQEPID